jgi:transcriptional regulator with XRE-family HTH domain
VKTAIDIYVINKILILRKKEKLSQAGLAFCIGVSKSFIANVENPKSRAKYNISHLNEVAKALNCHISDFFPSEPL